MRQNVLLDVHEAVEMSNITYRQDHIRDSRKGKHSCINQMACHSLKMFEKRLLSSFRSVVLKGLATEHQATQKARNSR